MKKLLTAATFAVAVSSAIAAPFLVANPYPTSALLPDYFQLSINGGSFETCPHVDITAGRQPKCDLVALVTPGTYSFVMNACTIGGIVNTPNGATNTVAGCASSSPFSYKLVVDPVSGPTLSVSP